MNGLLSVKLTADNQTNRTSCQFCIVVPLQISLTSVPITHISNGTNFSNNCYKKKPNSLIIKPSSIYLRQMTAVIGEMSWMEKDDILK